MTRLLGPATDSQVLNKLSKFACTVTPALKVGHARRTAAAFQAHM